MWAVGGWRWDAAEVGDGRCVDGDVGGCRGSGMEWDLGGFVGEEAVVRWFAWGLAGLAGEGEVGRRIGDGYWGQPRLAWVVGERGMRGKWLEAAGLGVDLCC